MLILLNTNQGCNCSEGIFHRSEAITGGSSRFLHAQEESLTATWAILSVSFILFTKKKKKEKGFLHRSPHRSPAAAQSSSSLWIALVD